FAVRTADGFPSLNRVAAGGGRVTTIAERFLGSTTAVGRDRLYFDQLEMARNVALVGDLYSLSRKTGQVTRLTSGNRIHDPDLSPDGTSLIAVQEHDGQRDLVRLTNLTASLPSLEVLLSAPETQFNGPRWSRDGRLVAVERHRPGTDPELALVDVASRHVRVLAGAAGTRVVTPTWRPDARAVVAAVAVGDSSFDLVEFPIDSSEAPR